MTCLHVENPTPGSLEVVKNAANELPGAVTALAFESNPAQYCGAITKTAVALLAVPVFFLGGARESATPSFIPGHASSW